MKLERDAGQQITAGRKAAGIRILWTAEETFDRAERDAKLQLAEIKRQEELANQQRVARANEKPGPPAAVGQPRAIETGSGAPAAQPSASDLEKARVAGIVHRYAAGYSALNAAAVYAFIPVKPSGSFRSSIPTR